MRETDAEFGLPPDHRQDRADLLFNRENGAGSGILRPRIGSSRTGDRDVMKSIQPHDPGAFTRAASSEKPKLKISAFENEDATRVIEILNTAAPGGPPPAGGGLRAAGRAVPEVASGGAGSCGNG
jgi:hypothetical protein